MRHGKWQVILFPKQYFFHIRKIRLTEHFKIRIPSIKCIVWRIHYMRVLCQLNMVCNSYRCPALPRSGRSLFRQQYRMFFHCYNSWRLRAMWDRRVRVPFPDDIFQKLLQTVQLLISALMQPVCWCVGYSENHVPSVDWQLRQDLLGWNVPLHCAGHADFFDQCFRIIRQYFGNDGIITETYQCVIICQRTEKIGFSDVLL